jgi:hypothetical protein
MDRRYVTKSNAPEVLAAAGAEVMAGRQNEILTPPKYARGIAGL